MAQHLFQVPHGCLPKGGLRESDPGHFGGTLSLGWPGSAGGGVCGAGGQGFSAETVDHVIRTQMKWKTRTSKTFYQPNSISLVKSEQYFTEHAYHYWHHCVLTLKLYECSSQIEITYKLHRFRTM